MTSSAASAASAAELPSSETFAAYVRISSVYNAERANTGRPVKTKSYESSKSAPFAHIFEIYGNLQTAGHVDDFYEDLFIMYQFVLEQRPTYTDEYMQNFPVDVLRRLFMR